MNSVFAPDRQVFDDVKSFLASSAAPSSQHPICIKNSQIDYPHILFNTEQLTREDFSSNLRNNFNLSIFQNSKIIETWDYSLANIDILRKNGVSNCRHVPFRIWPAYQRKILSYNSENHYNYDVAFCGGMNTRRLKITRELAECGVSVDVIENMYGEHRDVRIAKSRILLNIHFNTDYKIFEQLRCFAWLDTGKMVVSETSLDNDPRCQNSNYESLILTVTDSLLKYNLPTNYGKTLGCGVGSPNHCTDPPPNAGLRSS